MGVVASSCARNAMPGRLIRQLFDATDCYAMARKVPLFVPSKDNNDEDRSNASTTDTVSTIASRKTPPPPPPPKPDSLAAFSILGWGENYHRRVQLALQTVDMLRKQRSASNEQKRDLCSGNEQLDRSLGCILGNIVGDALGAPLEFTPVMYDKDDQQWRGVLTGMSPVDNEKFWKQKNAMSFINDSSVTPGVKFNRFRLTMGQWTDDGSMALCILDSLLCSSSSLRDEGTSIRRRGEDFDPLDLRQRFHAWVNYGYNNSFGRSADEDPRGGEGSTTALIGRSSVGLGGNIGLSIDEWMISNDSHILSATGGLLDNDNNDDNQDTNKVDLSKTLVGNAYTNGNGSIMRNSPIPVYFRHDIKKAMDVAAAQSYTTHGGTEAAECCKLLTWICIQFIQLDGAEYRGNPEKRKVAVLGDIMGNNNNTNETENTKNSATIVDSSAFTSPLYSVSCLANSVAETQHGCENDAYSVNQQQHLGVTMPEYVAQRNWNWKQTEYQYAPERVHMNPGYAGSYAMDGLCMSLHCVWTTNSFQDACLKAANLGGDADTVCAITAQIAGALYGISEIPKEWIDVTDGQWAGGSILARAIMCFKGETLQRHEWLSDEAVASAGFLGKRVS